MTIVDNGDGSNDGEGGGRPAATKKLSVPGKRQLTRDEVVAIRGYAEYHGKHFSDVSLEAVVEAGGVEKWSAVARDKAAEDHKPSAEQQARAQQMMNTAGARAPQLAIGDGTGTIVVAKKFYPMLVPRTNVKTREANIFNMVFVSRST